MLKTGDIVSSTVSAKVEKKYDVIVCGAGTAGCIAAIASARNGAKTAVVESGYYLGGMMTQGNAGLTKFIKHGIDADESTKIVDDLKKDPDSVQVAGGIPMEIVHRLLGMGAAVGTADTAASYVYTDSQEFKLLLFRMLRDAGVDIYLHSQVVDLIKEEERIAGIVTQTKLKRNVYIADFVIDATGDGDIAALAGVPFVIGVGENDEVYKEKLAAKGSLQNIGSMFRIGGVDFDRFTDFLKGHPEYYRIQPFGLMTYEEFLKAYQAHEMVIFQGRIPNMPDKYFQVYNYPRKNIMVGCISIAGNRNGLDTDVLTQAEYDVLLRAKELVQRLKENVPGFEGAFVLDVPMAGIRETRHPEGEYRLDIDDVLMQREFPDTIGKAAHPVDIYPLPERLSEMKRPARWYYNIPYRSLQAKGVPNLLLAGRCISSSREVAGCTRTTVACMVTGEAAGTAAALCIRHNAADAGEIPVEKLREQLKLQGVKL